MEYARDTCEIVATHAARRLRVSLDVDPDTRDHAREDLAWTVAGPTRSTRNSRS
jgi:hypothetical protein